MRRIFYSIAMLCCAVALSRPINAAEIVAVKREGVTHGIIISGKILPGDRQKFADLALSTDKAVVILSSEGGNVWDALEIGRAIRIKGFPTYVMSDHVCASACALIWLAGIPRKMSAAAKIGFHAVYKDIAGTAEVSSSGNAIVGSYLHSLGLSEAAIFAITSAAPDKMEWLSPAEFSKIGIERIVVEINRENENSGQKAPLQLGPKEVESKAEEFLTRYVAIENGDTEQDINIFSQAYTKHIFHFGKFKTNDEVVSDFVQFVNRWPVRKYVLRRESIKVSCSQTKCALDALLDWDVASPLRNARSTGLTSWHLELIRENDDFSIAAIDGKILQRRLSKMQSETSCSGIFCP